MYIIFLVSCELFTGNLFVCKPCKVESLLVHFVKQQPLKGDDFYMNINSMYVDHWSMLLDAFLWQ